ncbi:hypothetical protein A3F05_03895 [Candidatus Saccharibacteria bacterium RIFCSPHIGHO2_12_FULL_47_17]|nr:MAG: hypothetical protein A3F05_03895 [Candidatus Saccharibacteria bacterium RIFCSPHIGHO2_12_FULL_47_17]
MNVRQVEKIVKGFANRRRIQILMIIENNPGITLYEIAQKAKIRFRNASEHTRKLAEAELIVKKYKAQTVEHRLTDRGRKALKFCRIIE